jgi:hypothetical protein
MNILRKMLLVFLAGLLPLFLFTLAIDAGVIKTAGSSAPIKKILADSGIYDSIISGALDQAKTSGGDQGGGVSLTDPAVKQAAENTFTPQFLQQNSEKILDSVFVWLDGKTTVPDFQIDLLSLKSTFAVEAAKAAQSRAATLPACPAGVSGGGDSFDAFSATCLPKGLTPATVAAQVQNDITSGQGFIKDPVITADTVKSSGSSQSVFTDQLKNVPKAYQKVKKTPIILGILSLLAAVGIVFLSSSRAKGLRRVGITLVSIGVLLLFFAWALNYGVNQKALPKLNLDNKVLQEKVRTLVSDVTQSIDKTYWMVGGVYAGLGALAIAGSMFIHKRRGGQTQVESAHHEAPSEDVPEEAPAAEPYKKKNIKIQ